MTKSVFALAMNEDQARRIVDHLLSSGFSNRDISVLSPDHNMDRNLNMDRNGMNHNEDAEHHDLNNGKKKGHLTTEKHSKAPEGGITGATTGGILGGSLGLLAGIGALAIPGLGPFIAAGPIMAALSGAALGGTAGGIIGALIGSGIPEYEAKKYEAGLREGNILISVHAKNDDQIKQISDIMKKEGAKDISTSSEKSRSSH
ncbi:MAG TPA: hypothetical protein VGP47_10650 [Parachlamydiaceae bacterium]|nr:hypothetical protein [Parachlamydiaceae bacterium]